MSAAKVKMSITSAEAESMTDKFVEQMYRGTDPEIFTGRLLYVIARRNL